MTGDHQQAARVAARERQKRHRVRQTCGQVIYPVTVDGSVIDLLIRLGWLRDDDAINPRCVSEAIGAMLGDAARR
jgi:hypothetical protein